MFTPQRMFLVLMVLTFGVIAQAVLWSSNTFWAINAAVALFYLLAAAVVWWCMELRNPDVDNDGES